MIFFFFKQKKAYEMRISDWSSDVCSSDLGYGALKGAASRWRCQSSAKFSLMTRPALVSPSEPGVLRRGHLRMGRLRRGCRDTSAAAHRRSYRPPPVPVRDRRAPSALRARREVRELGRASCRVQGWQAVSIAVVAL